MATAQRLLKCVVSKGQFSDEVAVSGQDYVGETFSFFVNPQFVEIEGDVALGDQEGYLHVEQMDAKDDLVLIRLPGQTFGNGSTITVREDGLLARNREPA